MTARSPFIKPQECPEDLWKQWRKTKHNRDLPVRLADGTWVPRSHTGPMAARTKGNGVQRLGTKFRARCKVKGQWFNKVFEKEDDAIAQVKVWRAMQPY